MSGAAVEEGMKVCTKCKEEKPRSEFYKRASSPDGLQYRCKSCNITAAKKTQSANRLNNARGVDTAGVKVCVKCKTEKSKSEFYKCSTRHDGLQRWCKLCFNDYATKRHDANKLKNVNGVNATGTKTCSQCRKEKEKNEFSVNLHSYDGLRAQCKDCYSRYRRERDERNRRANEMVITRYSDARVAEKRCSECGETKSSDDFYRCVTNKGGLDTRCKKCSSQRSKSYQNRQNVLSGAFATKTGDKWSHEDDQFVIENHGKLTQYQMAIELGRTRASVQMRIRKLRQGGKLT